MDELTWQLEVLVGKLQLLSPLSGVSFASAAVCPVIGVEVPCCPTVYIPFLMPEQIKSHLNDISNGKNYLPLQVEEAYVKQCGLFSFNRGKSCAFISPGFQKMAHDKLQVITLKVFILNGLVYPPHVLGHSELHVSVNVRESCNQLIPLISGKVYMKGHDGFKVAHLTISVSLSSLIKSHCAPCLIGSSDIFYLSNGPILSRENSATLRPLVSTCKDGNNLANHSKTSSSAGIIQDIVTSGKIDDCVQVAKKNLRHPSKWNNRLALEHQFDPHYEPMKIQQSEVQRINKFKTRPNVPLAKIELVTKNQSKSVRHGATECFHRCHDSNDELHRSTNFCLKKMRGWLRSTPAIARHVHMPPVLLYNRSTLLRFAENKSEIKRQIQLEVNRKMQEKLKEMKQNHDEKRFKMNKTKVIHVPTKQGGHRLLKSQSEKSLKQFQSDFSQQTVKELLKSVGFQATTPRVATMHRSTSVGDSLPSAESSNNEDFSPIAHYVKDDNLEIKSLSEAQASNDGDNELDHFLFPLEETKVVITKTSEINRQRDHIYNHETFGNYDELNEEGVPMATGNEKDDGLLCENRPAVFGNISTSPNKDSLKNMGETFTLSGNISKLKGTETKIPLHELGKTFTITESCDCNFASIDETKLERKVGLSDIVVDDFNQGPFLLETSHKKKKTSVSVHDPEDISKSSFTNVAVDHKSSKSSIEQSTDSEINTPSSASVSARQVSRDLVQQRSRLQRSKTVHSSSSSSVGIISSKLDSVQGNESSDQSSVKDLSARIAALLIRTEVKASSIHTDSVSSYLPSGSYASSLSTE